jgi:heme/copper-type cytochrome/quinol oxidase subunit 2
MGAMSPIVFPGTTPPVKNGASAGPIPPLTDQERFDAAVERDQRIVLKWLAGVAIIAAFVMSAVALIISSNHSMPATMVRTVVAAAPAAAAPAAPVISLSVAGSNKKGPDGKLHDSFSKTDFAVKVGQPMRLRIDNTDSGPHSITAAGTGVNIMVLPGVHTYTLVAKKAGRFEWICTIPCDGDAKGWAMTHPGYMAGYISAT